MTRRWVASLQPHHPASASMRQQDPHPHPPHPDAATHHNPAVFYVFCKSQPIPPPPGPARRSPGNSPRNAASRRLLPAPARPGSCAQSPAGRRRPAIPPRLPPPARDMPCRHLGGRADGLHSQLHALRAPAAIARRMLSTPTSRAMCRWPPLAPYHKRSQAPNQRNLPGFLAPEPA